MSQIAILEPDELQTLVFNGVEAYFKKNPIPEPNAVQPDEVGGLSLAREISGYKDGTIYHLAAQKAMPHFKKRGKLRFRRSELEAWIESGKVKTVDELDAAAADYLENSGK